jgi:hypothetical protein
MALLDTFRARFPEFGTNAAGLPDVMVQPFLDAAALEVDSDVWGGRSDEGVMYLAAHKICLSPFGSEVREKVKDGSGTTYLSEFTRIQTQVGQLRDRRI